MGFKGSMHMDDKDLAKKNSGSRDNLTKFMKNGVSMCISIKIKV
jgi:hypothetical protein